MYNSVQTIQITKPWTSSQQNTTTGYGKWIDDTQDLVKIECYINDQIKQYITYHGFNTSSNNIGTQQRINQNGNTFNFFTIIGKTDP